MPSFYWQICKGGDIPTNAVRAGPDKDYAPIVVGRAQHERDLLPAKVVPNKGGAYVTHGDKEYFKVTYEVLCGGTPSWVPASDGRVPHSAFRAGQTLSGEYLYVGREMHHGAYSLGMVHPNHGLCYIPHDGKAVGKRTYDVLVDRSQHAK